MRIHFVSEHASPLALLGGVDAGGQNVHVAALATALASLGADVVVHTRRDDPALARRTPFCRGVMVDHVDAGPAEPIPKDELLPYMGEFADDLERQWRLERPDVVHAHYWMSGLAATNAAERLRLPVALTYHALGLDKRRFQGAADSSPDARIEIESWLARTVDQVIATSFSERRTLIELGARPGRATVVPCGVDLARFRVTSSPRYRSGRPRVVCVSRLVPRKGLTDVIHAVAGLANVELVIAGGPPAAMLAEDPYAQQLKSLAASLGVEDRVLLAGALDRAEVPALIQSASVVCCTPWYEPFGLVAVEAMACGVPVVASAVGGLAETVIDGVTGRLVPPRSPGAIRAALGSLLADPTQRATMGAAARRRAEHFGWERIARATFDVLATLVDRGPGERTAGTALAARARPSAGEQAMR